MYMTITLLATTNRVIFVKLIIILKHKNIDRNNSRIHDLNFPHFLTSKQPTPKSAGNSNYSNFVT